MIKELLTRAISQQNIFMTKDMLSLQIQFFMAAGKITQEDADELMVLLYPDVAPEELR